MRILATADIHAPKYLGLFQESLNSCSDGDILVIAGDLVLKNDFSMVSTVVSTIRKTFQGDIFACFGNEEYAESEAEYLKIEGIRWLRDEKATLHDEEGSIDLLGSRGSLDRPTFWQRRHAKDIWREYAERSQTVREVLGKCESTRKIVVTHYSPTYLTLAGENEQIWPELGSQKYESLIASYRPMAWIHGHVHSSQKVEASVGSTRVLNVSLPARGRLVEIEV